jgi:hypothetical protein
MHPVTPTRPSSTWLWRNLRDGATCTTRRRASVSLEARLGNPNLTCFHAKQAAVPRYRPPIGFMVQSTNRSLFGFEVETKKLSWWFWGPNHHRSCLFWGPTKKPSSLVLRWNRHHWFWGQNRENRPNGFEAKPLINRRHWFSGSTKKPTLLVSICILM